MKSFIAIALALALTLAACDGKAPEPPDVPDPTGATEATNVTDPTQPTGGPSGEIKAPRFTREEFPRLDGSTSTAPLAVAMAALMLGESEEAVTPLISFSRTTNSYYNLLHGYADLLIVSEGNEEVYDYRESLGFAWEQTPFAIDAFVFVVNEANPVDSLTVDEVRRIYTGEITNWSELGGADQEIIPLQRNPEAGSQSLMEKLVMRGTPMMEPPKEYVASSMGGLMEAVRGYDASAGAIGYSVYYYAEEMRAAKGLKLLKIDGVAPEPEAIRSGDYPLTNPYYVVIAASEPEGSPARVIRDWLLSEDGQRLAAEKGYVSVMELPTRPRETLPLVGTRLFEDFTDTLIPGDYGALVPYAGVRLTDSEFAASGCLFGLMTARGEVVVDPVFSDVTVFGDLVLMTRSDETGRRVAVAGRDGTWCTDFSYIGANTGGDGAVLYGMDSVTLMRPDGTVRGTYTLDTLGITREQYDTMRLGAFAGGGGEWLGDRLSVAWSADYEAGGAVLYFDLADGSLKAVDSATWSSYYPDYEPEEPSVPDAWYIYDAVLGRDAPAILEHIAPGSDVRDYLYEDGRPIPGLSAGIGDMFHRVQLLDGLIEVLEANTATYYDLETMEVVFRTYLGFDAD